MIGTVERIRNLLRPLNAHGDTRGFLRTSVDDDLGTAVAQPLSSMLAEANFAQAPYPPRHPPADPLPTTVDGLTALLKAVTLPADRLLSLLVSTCTQDLAYGSPKGPWDPETARRILEQIVRVLGTQACWWSNNDFSFTQAWEADGRPDCYASTSLTGYAVDRVLIGVGEGAIVTILAFADD
ncbi:hypothetical protein ACFOY2_38060 [Nonomuraea purpurea]|uniref:Uncharacterized protein n=1 Tax=Nonomuraea purpurea TaxID=1849276 RepID=A0ABV8GGJ5_9ACTN